VVSSADIDFHFETLTTHCSTVAFTPTAYLDAFYRGLKACSFPKSKFSMATLLEFRELMRNGRGEAVHIFGTLESLKNTILTLQSITIAILNLNHPAEDALLIC
jgi:hypothetical protein